MSNGVMGKTVKDKLKTVQELAATYRDHAANLKIWLSSACAARDEAIDQCCGGAADPRVCQEHPGNILFKLGWTYHPGGEEEGEHQTCLYCWEPPKVRLKGTGKREMYTFAAAMVIEYKRLQAHLAAREDDFKSRYPTALERVDQDDSDNQGM